VEHALYRKTGDWYHLPHRFPAALFDEDGYLLFKEPRDYASFVAREGVKEYRDTNILAIPNGIATFAGYISISPTIAEELPILAVVWEGARAAIVVNRYERDRSARAACIGHWGTTCSACDMSFAEFYGEFGSGFIQVHHLVPLSSIGKSYQLDPIRDLRPVCPNCHAMLHRQDPTMSIEELRGIIRRASTSRERNT
jgi:HNH endonuclease